MFSLYNKENMDQKFTFWGVLRANLVFFDPISSSTFEPKSENYNLKRENMGEH